MRKLTLFLLILIGVVSGVVLPPVSESVQAAMYYELPPSLREDLDRAINYEAAPLTVTLSHEDFFYAESISVSITASNPAAIIYYTLDSSTPNNHSEIYTEPLTLTAGEDLQCVVLKTLAIVGEEESAVLTHSYFLGETVHERFQTDYVFSLSTDPEHLYGYETGIMVAGKIYDDYMAETAYPGEVEWRRPANWNQRGREWERPVYVEAFTPRGERVLQQSAGIRLFGQYSRSFPQKPLRLVARREYDSERGKFTYPFFANHITVEEYPQPILSYDTLDFRNNGQDWAVAGLKTPLAAWIAEEAGYRVVSPYAAAAVFVNGEYYGYMALNARIDEHFLQDLYNAPERNFEIADVGYGEMERQNANSADEWAQAYASADEWLRMVDLVSQELDDPTMQELEGFIDIADLLFYHAFQTYIANIDWLPINMRVWRYTGNAASGGSLAEGLDGRWRYVIYDLDAAFRVPYVSLALAKGLKESAANESPFYAALLQQPRYAEEFSNHICDLTFEHFSVQNVERVIAEINKTGLQELQLTASRYEEAMRIERGIQLAPEREGESLLALRAEVMDFIAKRPEYALAELRELFGYTSMYRITTDGTAKINTLNGNEGQYFIENSVPVAPILEKGQAFDYWLVNGERRNEEDLWVSFADADASGIVHVECVARADFPPLFFLATYDDGERCGFTMYNPTDIIQSTRGLYLSDDIDNLKKWPFPDLNIRPGIVWEFVGQSSLSYDSLLKIGLNFNPRGGEVVFLSDDAGVVLDYMAVSG